MSPELLDIPESLSRSADSASFSSLSLSLFLFGSLYLFIPLVIYRNP